ncbi:MAG TPA: alpha/beta fold hydrolase [Anaerolineales bacterium]|nr:alpha/beta fold hydrolase [Anaerolineales bacterium]
MKITANGVNFNLQVSGEGHSLVLVHGFPLNSNMWAPQLGGLASSVRVSAPDLRGHGGSEVVPGPYSMDLLADDCASLLETMGVDEPVTLCGLSMGGYVAFSFFRRHPKRLRALILAATRAGADSPEGKTGREQAAATAQTQGTGTIMNNMLAKMLAPSTNSENPALSGRVRQIMEGNSLESYVGDLLGMRDRQDSTPTLSQIDIPTLILHGAEDQLIPSSEAENMHRAIGGSQLLILPSSGHLLNLEQPEQFNLAVGEFLGAV